MGVLSETKTGMTTAGENQIYLRPSNGLGLRSKYPVLWTHGAGALADIYMNYGHATVAANAITQAGCLGISADFGGRQTWGNDAAMQSMTDAYNWLQNKAGVKAGKIAISGGSMGGINALVWASKNISKVSCLALEIPVINLTDIWANNRGGCKQPINDSYGGAYNPTAIAPTRSPLELAKTGIFNNIPIMLNYGNSDQICLPEYAKQFASIVGSNVELHELNGGHAEATQLQIDRQHHADFILSHAE